MRSPVSKKDGSVGACTARSYKIRPHTSFLMCALLFGFMSLTRFLHDGEGSDLFELGSAFNSILPARRRSPAYACYEITRYVELGVPQQRLEELHRLTVSNRNSMSRENGSVVAASASHVRAADLSLSRSLPSLAREMCVSHVTPRNEVADARLLSRWDWDLRPLDRQTGGSWSPRPSFGTHSPMPKVEFDEVKKSELKIGTHCGSPDFPLHVVVVVPPTFDVSESQAGSTTPTEEAVQRLLQKARSTQRSNVLGSGAVSVLSTAVHRGVEPLLAKLFPSAARQAQLLLKEPYVTPHLSKGLSAVVTIMSELAGGEEEEEALARGGAKNNSVKRSRGGGKKSRIVGFTSLRFVSPANRPASVTSGIAVQMQKGSPFSKTTASPPARRSHVLSAVTTHEDNKDEDEEEEDPSYPSRIVTISDHVRFAVADALTTVDEVVGDAIRMYRPHHVLIMPPQTFLTPSNLRALCTMDPLINDDGEAISSYPFADRPFVPSGRKMARNGRLTVGLVAASSSSPEARSKGEFSSVSIVSSCRPPVPINEAAHRTIDGRHYSKGGDMVMRGSLWSLDIGSALKRNLRSNSSSFLPVDELLPPRTVVIPYLSGIHEDLALRVERTASTSTSANKGSVSNLPLTTAERLNTIFPHLRPIKDSHCSADPTDPVRSATFMVMHADDARVDNPRNAWDAILRSVNATALMTAHSDLFITTNAKADWLLRVLRAESKGLPPHLYVNLPETYPYATGLDGSGTRMRMPNDGDDFAGECGTNTNAAQREHTLEDFLHQTYLNPGGELVVITQKENIRGSWLSLASDVFWPMISTMGFHDVMRYTEDDAYVSRDQFEFFCATLPFLEKRDQHLNMLRYESSFDLLEEQKTQKPKMVRSASRTKQSTGVPAKLVRRSGGLFVYDDGFLLSSTDSEEPTRFEVGNRFRHRRVFMDVVQHHMPQRYSISDRVDVHTWMFNDKMEDNGAYAIELTPFSRGSNEPQPRRGGSSALPSFLSPSSSSSASSFPEGSQALRFTAALPIPPAPLAYSAQEIPIERCQFVGRNKSTQFPENNPSHVGGCYTLAPAYDGKLNRLYNAFFMLPTHRLQSWYLGGDRRAPPKQTFANDVLESGADSLKRGDAWRGIDKPFNFESGQHYGWNRNPLKDSLYREETVYFENTPLNTYTRGGVYAMYIEEGEGFAASSSHHAGWTVERAAQRQEGVLTGKGQPSYVYFPQPYGFHRLTMANHGKNEVGNLIGDRVRGEGAIKVMAARPPIAKRRVSGLPFNNNHVR